MNAARVEARRQGTGIKGLFELSDRLLDDQPVDNLLASIVTTLAQVFDARVLVERIELSRRPKVLLTAAPPIPTLAAYRRACRRVLTTVRYTPATIAPTKPRTSQPRPIARPQPSFRFRLIR